MVSHIPNQWVRQARATRLWMCAAMIYPAGPGAYDTEFVELPQAHLNRLRADLFRHAWAVAVVPALAFSYRRTWPLPLFWNYLTLSDGLLTVYEVA